MRRSLLATIPASLASIFVLVGCGGTTVYNVDVVVTPTPGPTPTPIVEIVVPTPTPPPDPLSQVNVYVQALNDGDIGALAAIYSEDVIFSVEFAGLGPFRVFTGKAEVVAGDAQLIAGHSEIAVKVQVVEGNTVRGEFFHTFDYFKDLGIDILRGTYEGTVEGGKIIRAKVTYDRATSLKVSKALDPRSVASGWLESVNAGDQEEAVARFADDVVHFGNGYGDSPSEVAAFHTFTGKAEVTSWLAGFVAQGWRLLPSEMSVEGNTVRARSSIGSPELRRLGIIPPPLKGYLEFVVQEGEIALLNHTLDDESVRRLALGRSPPGMVVNAYVEALNAGDIETLATLYADAIVASEGPFPFGELQTTTGKLAAMSEDLKRIADNARVTLSSVTTEGNMVRGEFSYVDDPTKALGHFTGTVEFRVEGGKLTGFNVIFDEKTQRLLEQLVVPPPEQPPQAGAVTFTAIDIAGSHQFGGPDTLPAGWTPVRLDNRRGRYLHHIQFIRLAEGKSADDLGDALRKGGPPPQWIEPAGGVAELFPGGSGTATINLKAGQYVLACFVPDEDGVPHLARGMLKPLTVTAATGPPTAEPEAQVTIDMFELGYTLSRPLAAGLQTVRVTNSGEYPHGATLVRAKPGASLEDLKSIFVGGKFMGGVGGIQHADHAYFTAVFEPGDYALISFMQATVPGVPDVQAGMIHQFAVE